jgi:hypothetical protein
MMSGLEWVKVVANGARLKYIKYFNKLIHSKKSEQNNSNKNKSNLREINQTKLNYNKFGFPFYVDKENRK